MVDATVCATVDDENASQTWWDAADREAEWDDGIGRALGDLRAGGYVEIPVKVWRRLTSLPGWLGGPAYAPTPLMRATPTRDEIDAWAETALPDPSVIRPEEDALEAAEGIVLHWDSGGVLPPIPRVDRIAAVARIIGAYRGRR